MPGLEGSDDEIMPGELEDLKTAGIPQHDDCDTGADASAHVIEQLIALARQIGRPREYVGFSAFLLMALLKRRRPNFWIGERLDDIVDIFIPNFARHCTIP